VNFSDTEFFPPRRKTRAVKVGRLTVGGDAAIAVQSMTKTDTREVEKTVAQIPSSWPISTFNTNLP
jgi:4-hydroxy-3-methylbut-2-en-1-yl diphosphate synthase IspG/GcpE